MSHYDFTAKASTLQVGDVDLQIDSFHEGSGLEAQETFHLHPWEARRLAKQLFRSAEEAAKAKRAEKNARKARP